MLQTLVDGGAWLELIQELRILHRKTRVQGAQNPTTVGVVVLDRKSFWRPTSPETNRLVDRTKPEVVAEPFAAITTAFVTFEPSTDSTASSSDSDSNPTKSIPSSSEPFTVTTSWPSLDSRRPS